MRKQTVPTLAGEFSRCLLPSPGPPAHQALRARRGQPATQSWGWTRRSSPLLERSCSW